jgi:hypothetical protein
MWKGLRGVFGAVAFCAVVLGAAVLIGSFVAADQRAAQAIIYSQPVGHSPPRSAAPARSKANNSKNSGIKSAQSPHPRQSAATTPATTVGSGAAETFENEARSAHHGRTRHATRSRRHSREPRELSLDARAGSRQSGEGAPSGSFFLFRWEAGWTVQASDRWRALGGCNMSMLELMGYAGKATTHAFRPAFRTLASEKTDHAHEVKEKTRAHARRWNRACRRLLMDDWGRILRGPSAPATDWSIGGFRKGQDRTTAIAGIGPNFLAMNKPLHANHAHHCAAL